MAATLAVVVIAPRLLLALIAGVVERYRAAHLMDDLGDAVLRAPAARLPLERRRRSTSCRTASRSATRRAHRCRRCSIARWAGMRSSRSHRRSRTATKTTCGRLPARSRSRCSTPSATPEPEAHGRFLARLAQSGRPLVVMVDEASLAARAAAMRAPRRRGARCGAKLRRRRDRGIVFVDLANPDVEAIEAAFARPRHDHALARLAHQRRQDDARAHAARPRRRRGARRAARDDGRERISRSSRPPTATRSSCGTRRDSATARAWRSGWRWRATRSAGS